MGVVIQFKAKRADEPTEAPTRAHPSPAEYRRAQEGVRDEIGSRMAAARDGQLNAPDPETEAFYRALEAGDSMAAEGILKNVRRRLGFEAMLRLLNCQKL